MLYRDFWEAGFAVFGLHGATSAKKCQCGNPKCAPKSLYKHPISSNWQHTPVWSEEQLETMEEMGYYATGYGVLMSSPDAERDLMVVDIDARNGGLSGYAKLVEDIPAVSASGMIVATGSGGGSKHLYFLVPKGMALRAKIEAYEGVDFKSGSSFVVGPGSLHLSGRHYEVVSGSPAEIDEAPSELLKALEREEYHRAEVNGHVVDVNHRDLAEMLAYVDNSGSSVDYDTWLKIGMALHHASGGGAYDLWDDWSRRSEKYDPATMDRKWHSFGKAANPVTLGTLVYYAERGGWVAPVTFKPEPEFDFTETSSERPMIDTTGVDLRRPPGFVGDLARWIEDQCMRPRQTMSAYCALMATANIVGLRYCDDVSNVTSNLIMFCVAGSATGKDTLLEAVTEVHRVAGLEAATQGNIKSEQEIVRNLVRHQPSFYLLDEVGFFLKKIKMAQTKGGASYLEGVIAVIMAAYSKATSTFLLSGDMKADLRAEWEKELTRTEKRLEEQGSTPYYERKKESLIFQLQNLDKGLQRPFLSMIGFTTPVHFFDVVDFENATNGFVGRAIVARERETVPKVKEDFQRRPMPEELRSAIMAIATGDSFSVFDGERIEYYKPRKKIPTNPDAREMLKKVSIIFDDYADEHKSLTGLEAIPMRGYELVSKISLILAVPGGVRTVEHVRYAYAMVREDIDGKIRVVTAEDRVKDNPGVAIRAAVADHMAGEEGETSAVIANRLRKKYKREDVEKTIELMVDAGVAEVLESVHKYNKSVVKRFRLRKR